MLVLKRERLKGGLFVAALVLICLPLVTALNGSSSEAPPRESETCLDCHDDMIATLETTPHQILSGVDVTEARVACTDCHHGDANHYEDDPEEYPMTNPASVDAVTAAGICSACHENSHQQNMQERNPHAGNGVGCTDCHQVHGVNRAGLLKDREVELCYSCHTDVRGEFAQPYRHPVWDEIVKCSDCHMFTAESKSVLSIQRTDRACFQCHNYFAGPYPFEHQATIGFSTQEGGCMACHRPHGSNVPRMLNQPYEAPDFSLCSQCHSVPGHNYNYRHGDEWAGVPCNDCHVDIHGSYVNRQFLSTELQSQGCFVATCHRF